MLLQAFSPFSFFPLWVRSRGKKNISKAIPDSCHGTNNGLRIGKPRVLSPALQLTSSHSACEFSFSHLENQSLDSNIFKVRSRLQSGAVGPHSPLQVVSLLSSTWGTELRPKWLYIEFQKESITLLSSEDQPIKTGFCLLSFSWSFRNFSWF